MEELASELVEQLDCVAVFSVNIGGYEIPIYESTVITWVIILILLLLSLFLTRNLQVHPTGKRQLFVEMLVTKIEGFITDMVGEEAKGICTVPEHGADLSRFCEPDWPVWRKTADKRPERHGGAGTDEHCARAVCQHTQQGRGRMAEKL